MNELTVQQRHNNGKQTAKRRWQARNTAAAGTFATEAAKQQMWGTRAAAELTGREGELAAARRA
jgi:hypothetical protein